MSESTPLRVLEKQKASVRFSDVHKHGQNHAADGKENRRQTMGASTQHASNKMYTPSAKEHRSRVSLGSAAASSYYFSHMPKTPLTATAGKRSAKKKSHHPREDHTGEFSIASHSNVLRDLSFSHSVAGPNDNDDEDDVEDTTKDLTMDNGILGPMGNMNDSSILSPNTTSTSSSSNSSSSPEGDDMLNKSVLSDTTELTASNFVLQAKSRQVFHDMARSIQKKKKAEAALNATNDQVSQPAEAATVPNNTQLKAAVSPKKAPQGPQSKDGDENVVNGITTKEQRVPSPAPHGRKPLGDIHSLEKVPAQASSTPLNVPNQYVPLSRTSLGGASTPGSATSFGNSMGPSPSMRTRVADTENVRKLTASLQKSRLKREAREKSSFRRTSTSSTGSRLPFLSRDAFSKATGEASSIMLDETETIHDHQLPMGEVAVARQSSQTNSRKSSIGGLTMLLPHLSPVKNNGEDTTTFNASTMTPMEVHRTTNTPTTGGSMKSTISEVTHSSLASSHASAGMINNLFDGLDDGSINDDENTKEMDVVNNDPPNSSCITDSSSLAYSLPDVESHRDKLPKTPSSVRKTHLSSRTPIRMADFIDSPLASGTEATDASSSNVRSPSDEMETETESVQESDVANQSSPNIFLTKQASSNAYTPPSIRKANPVFSPMPTPPSIRKANPIFSPMPTPPSIRKANPVFSPMNASPLMSARRRTGVLSSASRLSSSKPIRIARYTESPEADEASTNETASPQNEHATSNLSSEIVAEATAEETTIPSSPMDGSTTTLTDKENSPEQEPSPVSSPQWCGIDTPTSVHDSSSKSRSSIGKKVLDSPARNTRSAKKAAASPATSVVQDSTPWSGIDTPSSVKESNAKSRASPESVAESPARSTRSATKANTPSSPGASLDQGSPLWSGIDTPVSVDGSITKSHSSIRSAMDSPARNTRSANKAIVPASPAVSVAKSPAAKRQSTGLPPSASKKSALSSKLSSSVTEQTAESSVKHPKSDTKPSVKDSPARNTRRSLKEQLLRSSDDSQATTEVQLGEEEDHAMSQNSERRATADTFMLNDLMLDLHGGDTINLNEKDQRERDPEYDSDSSDDEMVHQQKATKGGKDMIADTLMLRDLVDDDVDDSNDVSNSSFLRHEEETAVFLIEQNSSAKKDRRRSSIFSNKRHSADTYDLDAILDSTEEITVTLDEDESIVSRRSSSKKKRRQSTASIKSRHSVDTYVMNEIFDSTEEIEVVEDSLANSEANISISERKQEGSDIGEKNETTKVSFSAVESDKDAETPKPHARSIKSRAPTPRCENMISTLSDDDDDEMILDNTNDKMLHTGDISLLSNVASIASASHGPKGKPTKVSFSAAESHKDGETPKPIARSIKSRAPTPRCENMISTLSDDDDDEMILDDTNDKMLHTGDISLLSNVASIASASIGPRSILNSSRKRKNEDTSNLTGGQHFKRTPGTKKTVAFGSPEAAEYNLGSPSVSMTPMPAKQAKLIFSMPRSQSSASSSSSKSVHQHDSSMNKMAEDQTVEMEEDLSQLLRNVIPENNSSVSAETNMSQTLQSEMDMSDTCDLSEIDTTNDSDHLSDSPAGVTTQINQEDVTVELEDNMTALLACAPTDQSLSHREVGNVNTPHSIAPESSPTDSVQLADAASVASAHVRISDDAIPGTRSRQKLDFEAAKGCSFESDIDSDGSRDVSISNGEERTVELESNLISLAGLEDFAKDSQAINDGNAIKQRSNLVPQTNRMSFGEALNASSSIFLEDGTNTFDSEIDITMNTRTVGLEDDIYAIMNLAEKSERTSRSKRMSLGIADLPSDIKGSRRGSRRFSLVPDRRISLSVQEDSVIEERAVCDNDDHTDIKEIDSLSNDPASPGTSNEVFDLTSSEIFNVTDVQNGAAIDEENASEWLSDLCDSSPVCPNGLIADKVGGFLFEVCAQIEDESKALGDECLSVSLEHSESHMIELQKLIRSGNADVVNDIRSLRATIEETVIREWTSWEADLVSALQNAMTDVSSSVAVEDSDVESNIHKVDESQETITLMRGRAARKARRRSMGRRTVAVSTVAEEVSQLEREIADLEIKLSSTQSHRTVLESMSSLLSQVNELNQDALDTEKQGKNSIAKYTQVNGLHNYTNELAEDDITIRFEGSLKEAGFTATFFPASDGIVNCDAYPGITRNNESHLKARSYKLTPAVSTFIKTRVEDWTNALKTRTLTSVRQIRPVIQHLEFKLGRLEATAREISILQTRLKAQFEEDFSSQNGVYVFTATFTRASIKLRASIGINSSYPFTPLDICLDPLAGSVDIEGIRRQLIKNAKPGFGYLSRTCDVISASLKNC